MTNITPFLKELLSIPGLSGYEGPAFKLIQARWKPLVHEIRAGRTGSLLALRRGSIDSPRPSVMLAAHMDAIGLMVTGVKDGFLRLASVGGVDPRVLPGTAVTVHATAGGEPRAIPAVVVQPSARLLPPELSDNPVPLEYLFADTGLPPRRVSSLVQVGDLVSYAQPPLELTGDCLAGHTLDNRVSVAAVTICLEELQTRQHGWDVWAVATSQEEVGLIGAASSAFELQPSLAIVLDVTWAKGPGASDWRTQPLGKGPSLCMGPNTHPALYKAVKDIAEKLEIPFNLEYAPRHTGTDAFATQCTARGIPSLVIGLPLRYMHTPVELVSVKDIQRAGRLLAGFISNLDADFMKTLTLDD